MNQTVCIAGPDKLALLSPPSLNLNSSSSQLWPEPQPFEIQDANGGLEAPLWTIPPRLRDFIRQAAQAKQTPEENLVAAMLGCLSTVCAGRFVASWAPQYYSHAHIWIIHALRSTGGKSEGFGLFMQAVRNAEKRLEKSVKAQNDRNAHARATLSKGIAELEAGMEPEHAEQLLEAREALEKVKEQPLPRFIRKDVSPQKLDVLYAKHQRVGILSAEGSDWLDLMLGKQSDTTANLASALAGFSVEACGSDRITRNESMCQRPVLSLYIAIQDHVFHSLASDPVVRQRGFLGRCFIVKGKSWVGGRLAYEDRPTLSPADYRPWEVLVEQVTSWIPSSDEDGWLPFYLPVSPEACAFYSALFTIVEKRLSERWNDDASLRDLEDIAGRALEQVGRMACLLHVAWCVARGEDPRKTSATPATVFRAFALMLWALGGFLDLTSGTMSHQSALELWQDMDKHSLFASGTCSWRAWTREGPNRWRSSTALEPAIEILEELGYVQLHSEKNSRGRATKTIELRPASRQGTPKTISSITSIEASPLFQEALAAFPNIAELCSVEDELCKSIEPEAILDAMKLVAGRELRKDGPDATTSTFPAGALQFEDLDLSEDVEGLL